jgi:beta-1,2-N-acetylglucosaminyltransferase
VLDHSKDPCASNFGFIPKTKDKVYLMFISMEKHNDYGTWMEIAKCYHLWDLDARGFHKGLWRFWINGNHLMVIGVPFSPYRKYKPDNVTPIKLQKPKKT